MKILVAPGLALLLAPALAPLAPGGGGEEFTDDFMIEDCSFSTEGRNPYFPLVPGSQRVLIGEEDGEQVVVEITTLHETERVDGVRTRVVEEREWVDGELAEVSRNFFAQCRENGSVFYFGEEVDIYEDGEVVSHEGAWRAGRNGARAGVVMPGLVLVGSRYFQEVAPGVALDRAEHVTLDAFVETPAGTFPHCLFVEESSPIDAGATSEKHYSPGVGLVKDDELELVRLSYGHDDDDDGDRGDCDDDDRGDGDRGDHGGGDHGDDDHGGGDHGDGDHGDHGHDD